MKILITGATGEIGKRVALALYEKGHDIVAVSRSKKTALKSLWCPAEIIEKDLITESLSEKDFAGIDAVIHLMGESIDGRWTNEKKQKILSSRVESSKNLIQNMPASVKHILSASAQGYYPSSAKLNIPETEKNGDDFLAEVCKQWEAALGPVSGRLTTLRIGLVLSAEMGALKKMIAIFRNQLGAPLGSGKQWMSWVALDDLVRLMTELIVGEKPQGVLNAVSDSPVTNQEFSEVLARCLGSVLLPKAPAFVIKTALGQMSDLVLNSYHLSNQKVKNTGFEFRYKKVEDFLQEELKDFQDGHDVYFNQQFWPVVQDKVFHFFSLAENLETITPPSLQFKILKKSTPTMQKNTLIDYQLKIHGLPAKWKTKITDWNPPHRFVDNQESGPYKKWHHTHSFRTLRGGGTLMADRVIFKLPAGILGQIFANHLVRSDVENIFHFRTEILADYQF